MSESRNLTRRLSRSSSFDNDNRVTADTTNTVNGAVTTTVAQTYDYRAWDGSGYNGADQGVVTHTRADQSQSGSGTHVYTDTKYYYTWWDEAKQASIRINASNPSNPNSGLWALGLSGGGGLSGSSGPASLRRAPTSP